MRSLAQNPPQKTPATRDRAHGVQGVAASQIHQLQRTIGNQAVQRMLQTYSRTAKADAAANESAGSALDHIPMRGDAPVGIQPKLTVNTPGDIYEQEADRIADQVMRMTEPSARSAPSVVQRQCAECDDKDHAQDTSRGAAARVAALQGTEDQDEESLSGSQATLFRKAGFAAPPASGGTTGVADRLADGRTSGEPLSAATRETMEDAFGHDFSRVRIHRDAVAGELSRQLNALAFTHGSHVYFGDGQYDPDGSPGRRLLAHELTHVVQQGEAERRGRAANPVTANHERPANLTSGAMVQRTATWAPGVVHQTNNLATALLNGTDVGVTSPTLNGTILQTLADTRAALVKPTLAHATAASGGVNATVATVATNTGSFDETVLAAGPWSTTALKTAVGAKFGQAACAGGGNSTLTAKGLPTDAAMFAANRRHEDHHAADGPGAFNGSIGAWDTLLTAAASADTVYNGADEATADAALYAAMGGTPKQVADEFSNAWVAAINTYHATAAGGVVEWSNPTANADCSTSSIDATNPS